MALNLKSFGPKLLEKEVEVRVINHVIQAWSKASSKWVNLDQSDWFIEAPRPAKTFYVHGQCRIPEEKFAKSVERLCEVFHTKKEALRASFRVEKEYPEYTRSQARTKSGRPLRDFHYVDGKLFANVYAW